MEARQAQQLAQQQHRDNHHQEQQGSNPPSYIVEDPRGAPDNVQQRQLRDIVTESNERWLLPTADADAEYHAELRAMGYRNEELEQHMQDRGREYHGMLRMGCRRHVQCTPKLVRRLDKGVRVVAVSAGYAHAMLLSDAGMLYAAGYNDRGQLGLG